MCGRLMAGIGVWRNPEKQVDGKLSVRYPVHIMKSITYTEAREKLADAINRVCEDHDPWVITKRRDKAVVMISLEDYESLVETAHLLKSPRNARRLLESIEQLEKGKGKKKKLAS